MSDGRTVWWAKDSAWWRRERVVELGEEFGSAGPAVVDWLACEAKAQNAGGRVQAGHRTVARGCFVELVTVGHVLSRAVTLGLLDDFVDDSGRFECRISGWGAEQERVKAATRKAEQRIRDSAGKGDPPRGSRSVTPGHVESRSVTESPSTGQDRTGPEENTITSDAGGADEKATEEDRALCRLLAELALERNPKFKVKSRGRWLTDMRLLRDRDGNSAAEIEEALRWVFGHSFWGGVIQSPGNLRDHFSQIWDQMGASKVVPIRKPNASELIRKINEVEAAS